MLHRLFEIFHLMLIAGIHEGGMHQEICRCLVVGNRDIVNLGDPEQCLDIRIMWLRRQRIRKEDHHVDLSFYDLGTDLLVPRQADHCYTL